MSPRKKKEDNSGVTPLDQINSYLEQNKGDHYNFEEERVYTVSSGSLKLDIEMGGGIKKNLLRFIVCKKLSKDGQLYGCLH